MPRSRRKTVTTTKTGLEITSSHCRRCMNDLPPAKFYTAVDFDLDKNGLLSICRDCIGEMFDLTLSVEHSIEKTVLVICRKLNIKFSQEAINSTIAHMDTLKERGTKDTPFMGIYFSKLHATNRTSNRMGDASLDLTYQDAVQITVSNNNPLHDDEFEEARDLKMFWGTEDKQDIEFLENELASFKQTHRADTYAEIVLLKEVCYKLLEINKSRRSNTSTDSSLKQLMDVMKNLAISPNQANAASAGKGADCFGVWLKEISELRPEEWYEDQSIYKDVDNIEEYNERIFISSMRAFTTGNREFTIEGGEIVDDDAEGE
jgi:hypothetical protein